MGEEFYSIIKLVSGEEIFSLVSIDENDGDTNLILQNPIIMKMIQHRGGMHVKIKPWIDLSDDDIFIIKSDKVITMFESRDERLIEIYTNFIEDTDEDINFSDTNECYTRPSTDMGYVSSVKEARKELENIFNKEIQENQSSD